ncbi:YoaK family protein [Agrobacterium rosae]|uniref:YoaK family protein n=1 Tax=Agrobacterium rosae TaxID=1972867 RepID=A0ABU4W431_9HYPH|nr:YoaK family protein [Agrobacterium rosae]MDX8332557.1 YoaK family protein [Agrobacterium rosae]
MLISQGDARNERINFSLACSLAAIAGALNASAFYAVGFFAANMTGNVSALSDHLATRQWGASLFFLAIVVAFILGATLSSLLINAGRRRDIAGIYAWSILVEAILLALLGCADLWLLTKWRGSLLVLGLALLMGLQNATVTHISKAHVRTTHISGMATDLGIELGALIDIRRGQEPDGSATDVTAKLKLHAFTIAAFLIGGIIGVIIYQALSGYLLIACAVLLFLIAMAGLRKARRTLATTATRRPEWRPFGRR